MLASLEVRAPFLDHRVIEFAFSRVPDRYRTTMLNRKVLLRQLGRKLLPKEFEIKRKQGFSIPLSAWFKGSWGTTMCEILSAGNLGSLDSGAIGSIVSLQKSGYSNMQRLFGLTMLELWRREYNVK